ncbi:MAG: hypothetical protein WAN11_01315 [Syntrophobacteraceae bacterium]
MDRLHLTIVIGLFVLGLAAPPAFAGNSDENPVSVSEFDKGFMTDRLLEEDIHRGSNLGKDHSDRDQSECEQRREQSGSIPKF